MTDMGVTRALVGAVRGLAYDDISADALEVGRHCVLDYFGVALAGSSEPLVNMIVDTVVAGEGSEAATLIGRGQRASALTAALVNGAAGHALDYDDTHTTMSGHPTVPVLPALLAFCESEGVGGKALLTALVAGIELECRLGALLGEGHYELGFHATGTLGTFGAAAACAHVMNLSEEQWLSAMGLAGIQAAGLKSAFGTMGKPLHAGKAATNGLQAALLAREGFSAPPDIVETSQGFAETHGGREPSIAILDKYAGRFLTCETLFKYHASCYLTHAAIEAARTIRESEHLTSDSVESVKIHVAPSVLKVCNIQNPITGLEGKFSLRATTALALLGEDTSDLGVFCEEKMGETELVRIRDCVTVVPTEGLKATQARVCVEAAGQTFERETDSGVPSQDLPAQRERLTAKFMSLAGPVVGTSRTKELAATALAMDSLDTLGDLLHLAGAGASEVSA